jgi:hypothetical protein
MTTQTSPDTTTPCETNSYYFDEQLKRYITQFMAVFAGFWVRIGVSAGQPSRLIRVPIVYGSMDRVAAWIKAKQTQNVILRLPTFACYLQNVQPAPELRKGLGQVRRNTVARNTSIAPFPENIETVYQQMPVPYRGTFELSVFASNTLQHQQIMEQILVLFDPQLQIQTSDDPLDWTQITTLTLQSMNWDINYPSGANRRIIQSVLHFDVPFYLSGPAEVKNNFVQEIQMRIATVPTDTIFDDSYSVLEALDAEGAQYNEIFSLSNINIENP